MLFHWNFAYKNGSKTQNQAPLLIVYHYCCFCYCLRIAWSPTYEDQVLPYHSFCFPRIAVPVVTKIGIRWPFLASPYFPTCFPLRSIAGHSLNTSWAMKPPLGRNLTFLALLWSLTLPKSWLCLSIKSVSASPALSLNQISVLETSLMISATAKASSWSYSRVALCPENRDNPVL